MLSIFFWLGKFEIEALFFEVQFSLRLVLLTATKHLVLHSPSAKLPPSRCGSVTFWLLHY